MNEYCQNHKDLDYCKYVERRVPAMFCKLACQCNWRQFMHTDREPRRDACRKPVEDDGSLVTVIVPVCRADEQYLDRTAKSVLDNAMGRVEFVPVVDWYDEGIRTLLNRLVDSADSKYIVKLDCHTALTKDWDVRMKLSCGENVIVKPVLDCLDTERWEGKGYDMGPVIITSEMATKYQSPWRSIENRRTEEETMGLIGCCWMIRKDYYKELGGCDESLGKWGLLGAEWSLKTWLTGGKCLLRTDVVCSHLFRKQTPFEVDLEVKRKGQKKLLRLWVAGESGEQTRPIQWLLDKFVPVIPKRALVTA